MGYQYQTSKPAYEQAKLSIAESQSKVLEAIKHLCRVMPYRRCNDKDIQGHLGWDINRITPRRGELVEMGKVKDVGKFKNNSGKLVTYWQPVVEHTAVTQIDLFKK